MKLLKRRGDTSTIRKVVGEITRKELVKKYGVGTYGTITKVGRLLLADKEGIKL